MDALSLIWFARWFRVTKTTTTTKQPSSTANGPIFKRSLSKMLLEPYFGRANRGKPSMVSSYAARVSGSLKTSFASAISLNKSSAFLCSCFGKRTSLSGWYCSARRRYFLAISVAFAARVTLSAP